LGKPSFEQFYAVSRFSMHGNVGFSPDGTEVSYAHDGSGQFNLYRQPVKGGAARQLTEFVDDAARHHVWTPSCFVLGVDHHGDEKWQLNRLAHEGGRPADMTQRPDVQYVAPPEALHEDGNRLAFMGNATRPTDMSIYLLHVQDGEIQPLIEDNGNWGPGPWHPDGRRLAVGRSHGNTDQDVYALDTLSGERQLLTEHQGEEVNRAVGFSADGRGAYLLTDRDHENQWLALRPLDGGETQTVWKGDWDVEHAALSGDRRRLAFVVNEDGISTFHARDLNSGQDVAFPEMPRGHCFHFSLSRDGRRAAAVVGTATRPFDLYVADLDSGSLTRLTDSFQGGIPESDLVDAELVRYPTFDGRQVPAWLYQPRGANGRAPVLLSIHGGPEAQERPGNSSEFAFFQYLLSRGVGVLAPNIRGSSGYGKSYQKLIHRDFGGDDLKDIEACAGYLRSLDWVDPDRLAVYGGSYGGFASLSAMTRLPQYWACGVDVVGPSNLVTFAKAVPPFWREMMKAWVGDPYEEPDFLMERSPITYVENVRAPLLVLQGAMDPRVVKPESDQMVEKLRSLGSDVEYHVFEDEGHGFTKQANQLKAYRLISDFLFKHLKVEA
jgi:dipeptidyl aminopeptidase/acylaminoacyl peptidase